MRRTARVKIRGRWWTVRFQKGGDTSAYGVCKFDTREIIVRRTPESAETLIHEIIHACQPDLNEDAVLEIEAAIATALNTFYNGWKDNV
jgi:hypothetical protein